MSDIAIRVEHLSKQYRLGGQQARYATFREALVNAASAPLRWLKGDRRAEANTIWALDDVSFEIKHGEAVGIIGRNGAGKSTLLKILSRITRPTKGRVEMFGRVGSLLEVGTGFHPELTGRENIFLNGAILGMKRREMQRKFDEIVDFAEVEKFLDTPVKFYSSGMYVRLAFAVAAHLEPEILLVDEVLAVGDAQFQKKCLGRMGEVAQQGRTVLFVSHNMGAIRNLCAKCIFLSSGHLDSFNHVNNIISKYLKENKKSNSGILKTEKKTEKTISILEVSIRDDDNNVKGFVESISSFKLRIVLYANKKTQKTQIHVRISNHEGINIFTLSNTDGNNASGEINEGKSSYEVSFPANFLLPDIYNLVIAILEPNIRIYDIVEGFQFEIEDTGNPSTILRDGRLGVITPVFKWNKSLYEG